MSAAKKTALGRNLALIRESGSTARVLNLAFIFDRHGGEDEHRDRPLFHDKRLNRAVILKHAVRPRERELFSRPPMSATKIVMPFASSELDLGGMALMVDQIGFPRMLRELLGGNDPGAFQDDFELLQLIDSLPSFDPFLMRERLRQSGREPARCYFEVSEADVERMRTFVGQEISQLVGLAFANGGAGARELSAKLADKLMTDETATALDPLRETLRMSGAEYREGVFAWKGFLYYKWLIEEFKPRLAALKAGIETARILRPTQGERAALDRLRERIVQRLDASAQRVQDTLIEYGVAFAALSNGQPTAFRDFLLKAPALFLPLGEAIGVIKHIDSFWGYRFPKLGVPLLPADEALELFEEFDLTLAGIEYAADALTTEEKSAGAAA